MNFAKFPRRRYTPGPTPIQYLPRFTRALGGPEIWIKRDDLTGLTAGGNKTRKLEFLVAAALEQGADTLITCGAVQSNHCRLTLAAAVTEGMHCRLVLEERVPGSYQETASGNNFLYRLLGVEAVEVVPGGSDIPARMNDICDVLEREGRRGYVIPGGGSNPVGATGYAVCAGEILSQAFDMGLEIDHVVCASGSAGTQAGLVAGFEGWDAGIPVLGVNVSRDRSTQEELVYRLADETARHIGLRRKIDPGAVTCLDEYVGSGYSLPTPEMAEAVRLLARTEGILLDPVYTGKAMAGLIDQVRKGMFPSRSRVLFVHTGGSPALYAYEKAVLNG